MQSRDAGLIKDGADPRDGPRGPLVTAEVPQPSHTVQFYENDHFLAAAVADFLAPALASGQPVVIIAEADHSEAFLQRLRSKGLDPDDAFRNGRMVILDAAETLAQFMNGNEPDPDRFTSVVGGVIGSVMTGSSSATVRAYGEMVDILWRAGNTDGAVRLEELWNSLGEQHSIELLCAYGMGNFYKESHTGAFRQICGHHTAVVPAESYTRAEEPLLEITLLQQRARALEHEVETRRVLEARLREAIAEREMLLEHARSAQAKAEAASRAKSEFLAMMSHELRTPLNAIGGYVQIIQMGLHGPVSDEQREALERVERSQRHLLSLINNVLNLVRVEKNTVEYDLAPLDLPLLMTDVVGLIEPLISAASLRTELRAPADKTDFRVLADADKVRQILLNLLTNAIKFTGEGGSIRIEFEPCATDPSRACVHVSDTGTGIPHERLQEIFEPFVQLGVRPQSGQEGLGLGLAISRDLARAMGGELEAASELGRGSTFTLTLPRA